MDARAFPRRWCAGSADSPRLHATRGDPIVPPQERTQLVALRSEGAGEVLTRSLGQRPLTAHEHVARGIAELGPGVDRDVRFGQQGERGDALVVEAMRDLVQQDRSGLLRCLADRFDDRSFVVEHRLRTTVQLEDAM